MCPPCHMDETVLAKRGCAAFIACVSTANSEQGSNIHTELCHQVHQYYLKEGLCPWELPDGLAELVLVTVSAMLCVP